jgi:FtsP/CotA-like multicopper oxidase with cupredoxin domain
MNVRKLLNTMTAILVSASLFFGGVGQARAQKEPAPAEKKADCGKLKNPKLKQGRVKFKDKKAAADCTVALGLKAGMLAAAAPTPGGVPDYFGAAPNWGFSPLPTGSITSIKVDLPGSGYTNPTVSITDAYGNGSGATATATLDANGGIASITVNAAGSGYVAPVVLITDLTGIDAAASAILGNFIGGIHKFVDPLPALAIAVPDTTTYPGSDYYVIELGQFTQKLHRDLPLTTLRGYRQVNASGLSSAFSYLGPLIVAQRDRPVRVKFINNLSTGAGGNLFIPVDTSVMGSGTGPSGTMYSQNRATLHLHGGNTPWISDGTQHQWITPAGESTSYPEGVAVENVPDMAAAGCNGPTDGCQTFFYTNQQSARLLFYHDHAYGITRLNVYVGEAAGYLVTDSAEQTLINGGTINGVNVAAGTLPGVGTPLVIQDKTFVDPNTIAKTDPTWNWGMTPGTPKAGDLWFPHVYMPNQNPYDITGANAMGRWDYGQWFWPPFTGVAHGPVPNPYCLPTPGVDCSSTPWEPPFIPGTPNPSIAPEAFMDTPLVNGAAYPTLTVPAGLARFRILNAANDRYWNLSLWVADPSVTTVDGRTNTEVKMVPWNSSQNAITPFPSWWYDSSVPNPFDDRVGGVPDPTTRGPAMIQIGSEAGFLAAPAMIKNQPINYVMNKRDITVGNVAQKALFLGPAERADVVVDFSNFAGKTLILYSDSPAPVPASDPRVDYFTGDPDQSATGGAPSTIAGFGPNTRTIMQIVVSGSGGTAPVDDYSRTYLSTLTTALQAAYAASQPKPLVPNAVYNAPFGANYPTDSYARISDNQLSFQGTSVSSLTLTSGGAGFTSVPTVSFSGGGGSGAAATATLSPAAVGSVNLSNSGGFGYTSAPTVTLSGGGGTGAAATAALGNAGVRSATITNGGSGYLAAPTVTFSAPSSGGVRATGTAVVQTSGQRRVTAINITNPGSGYLAAPTITFTAVNGGSGAAATSNLGQRVVSFTVTNGGTGYASAPSVTVAAPPASNCVPASFCTAGTATATLAARVVTGLTLTSGGSGYTSAPTVTISGGGGSNATATASLKATLNLQPKSIIENFDPEYGRMNALLGVEIPNTTGLNQTSIPYADIDPPTELFTNSVSGAPIATLGDGTQIWKITHNGVDTHAMHWHMFDVQVINRVGWDGAIRPPDANEIGWKDTIRMNPLEDIIVALRPIVPTVPFGLPNSIRPLDVVMPTGADAQIGQQTAGLVDPQNNPVTVSNQLINYGYEFIWHCHLLGHEENIMMRSIGVADQPVAPSNFVATKTGSGNNQRASLSWKDNSTNETGWIIQQATSATGPWTTVGTIQIPLAKDAGYTTGGTVTFTTPALPRNRTLYFQVLATNVVGLTQTFAAPAVGFPTATANSQPALSNSVITN